MVLKYLNKFWICILICGVLLSGCHLSTGDIDITQMDDFDWLDDCTLEIIYYRPTVNGEIDAQLLLKPLSKEGDGYTRLTINGRELKDNVDFQSMIDYMKKEGLLPLKQEYAEAGPNLDLESIRLRANYYALYDKKGKVLFETIYEDGMMFKSDAIYCNGNEMELTDKNRILIDCFNVFMHEPHFGPEALEAKKYYSDDLNSSDIVNEIVKHSIDYSLSTYYVNICSNDFRVERIPEESVYTGKPLKYYLDLLEENDDSEEITAGITTAFGKDLGLNTSASRYGRSKVCGDGNYEIETYDIVIAQKQKNVGEASLTLSEYHFVCIHFTLLESHGYTDRLSFWCTLLYNQ